MTTVILPWSVPMVIDTTPTYPLTVLDYNFDFLTRFTDVIVIASSEHFGVLVALSSLPPAREKLSRDKLHSMILQEIANQFYELATDYVEASHENDFPLPLPDPDQLENEFSFVVLRLTGKIGKEAGSEETLEDLILSGDYLFISEIGVNITEFFIETKIEGSSALLH